MNSACKKIRFEDCPFCSSDDIYINYELEALICNNCGAIGPHGDDIEQAIQKWNERKEN